MRGKGGRGLGPTTLPSSCVECPEIVGASTYWPLKACPDLYRYFSLTALVNLKVGLEYCINNVIRLVKLIQVFNNET